MLDSSPPQPSRLQRLYRKLPVELRRRVGAQAARILAPSLARGIPSAAPSRSGPAASALIIGLLRSSLGQSMAARLCAAELRQGGVAVSTLDVSSTLRAPTTEDEPPSTGGSDADAAVIVLNPEEMAQGLRGPGAAALEGRRVVAYWVWETERAPSAWRKLAGHVPHEIWAPSRFAADALRAVFDQPVTVVPHPCALAPPPEPTPERRAAMRGRLDLGPDDFVAVSSCSVASSLARKNPAGAIEAFSRGFAGRSDARLILRCGGGEAYPAALQELKRAVRDARAPVTLLDADGWGQLLDLYAAADAYLSLHRSEGFGLNLAEAMLSGLPLIATAWSGNLDFMDEASAALVPARLVPVRDPQGVYRPRDGRWAEPDLDAAAEWLRKLRSDCDLRLRLGAAGREAARARLAGGGAARVLRSQVGGWGPDDDHDLSV
jgi:glycosyltransferase involved in cell wall biosynthesis